MDRVVDVSGRVVSHFRLHSGRQFFFDLLELGAHVFDHVNGVGVRQNENAHEDGFLAGEAHFSVVIFGAEHDVRDVAQPDERAFVLFDDELFELISRVQIGVRGQVHLKQGAFGAPDGREKIVFGKSAPNIGRRNIQCGHALRFHPNAHRERTPSENVG